ncbi:Metalloendopeptidase [Meloidogyne graminicola]|uniref:Metalloendopeptidase n=1 Tax=Meloidogyne graminicola TaxID=189291 RepID=A0A8S9ZI70_9BILA|nr:Metalloendopeptidase [Meloidogyne graminicola]
MCSLINIVALFFTIQTLINIIQCGSNFIRAKRESDRHSWITDSAHDWILETTNSDEENIEQSSFSEEDYLFIGDMVFQKSNFVNENNQNSNEIQFSVVKDKSRIWAKKEVPIHVGSSIDTRTRRNIKKAISLLEGKTCITFPRYDRNRHKNYVTIRSDKKGCFSNVGMISDPNGEKNQLNLQPGIHCGETSTIIHELMHTLGVYHEMNRYDRDNYIEVLWHNLKPDVVSQFTKESGATIEVYGEPYDYGSIMHYQVHAGTRNGLPGFRVLRHYDEELIDLVKKNHTSLGQLLNHLHRNHFPSMKKMVV